MISDLHGNTVHDEEEAVLCFVPRAGRRVVLTGRTVLGMVEFRCPGLTGETRWWISPEFLRLTQDAPLN